MRVKPRPCCPPLLSAAAAAAAVQTVLGGSAGAYAIGGTLSLKGWLIVGLIFESLLLPEEAGAKRVLVDIGAGHIT